MFYDNLYRLDYSTLNDGNTTVTNLDLQYDAAGNIRTKVDVADNAPIGQSITWTSFNYPSQITANGQIASFAYGPDRQRWRMTFDDGTQSETTLYAGGLTEKVTQGGTSRVRYTIAGGSGVAAIYTKDSAGSSALRYVLTESMTGPA